MYNYPQYKEEDRNKVVAFMKEHPFVMLTGCDENQRVVFTQIPVLIDEVDGKIILSGHIARKSDHERAFMKNPEVLIVFTGAHTYVSGTWYSGNLQQASTWNYISVHARGQLRWMNEEGLIKFLKRFTLHFENNNKASTTIYDNLPADYLEKLVKAIVGFEMVVEDLENVFKLSQNRDEKSYHNVVKQLEKQGGDASYIAEKMKTNAGNVFGE